MSIPPLSRKQMSTIHEIQKYRWFFPVGKAALHRVEAVKTCLESWPLSVGSVLGTHLPTQYQLQRVEVSYNNRTQQRLDRFTVLPSGEIRFKHVRFSSLAQMFETLGLQY